MSGEATETTSAYCRVEVEDNVVIVSGPGLHSDRKARLFFSSMLGGERYGDGWRIRARSSTVEELTVKVSRWLQRSGRASELVGDADETVQRDNTRRLSFTRTVQAARLLRRGESQFTEESINAALRRAGWDFEQRTLRPHQVEAVIHGLTAANPANFSVPGAGKTASTLGLAAVHLSNDTIENILVVGPLSCFRPWEDETRAALPDIRTRRIRGTAQQRRAKITALPVGEMALVSYASAASDYRQLIELCRRRKVLLVADESHRIKRFSGGTWAPAILDIASYAIVRVVLSGTPMPQSGKDLFTQLNVMWPGAELTGPRPRFANAVDNHFSSVLDDVLPFVSRTPKSVLGLKPPVFQTIHVPLGDQESAIYRLVLENFRRRVRAAGPAESAQLESLRRGRPIRLLQASTNAALLRGHVGSSLYDSAAADETTNPTLIDKLRKFSTSETPPAKFVAALDIILRHEGEKVVVWSAFVANLDEFSEYVRRRGAIEVFQVDGRVQAGDNDDDLSEGEEAATREQVIEQFLDSPGAAVLVTNPASCSESISLHKACRVAVYLDRTYDCAQWLQSIDRIHRLGLDPSATVRIYVLEAEADGLPTADALVQQSLGQKEERMRELLEGATLSPFRGPDGDDAAEDGDEEDLKALLAFLLGEAN